MAWKKKYDYIYIFFLNFCKGLNPYIDNNLKGEEFEERHHMDMEKF